MLIQSHLSVQKTKRKLRNVFPTGASLPAPIQPPLEISRKPASLPAVIRQRPSRFAVWPNRSTGKGLLWMASWDHDNKNHHNGWLEMKDQKNRPSRFTWQSAPNSSPMGSLFIAGPMILRLSFQIRSPRSPYTGERGLEEPSPANQWVAGMSGFQGNDA